MSQQALLTIIYSAEQDETLQKELQMVTTPEHFVKIGAEHGYEFTVEELIDIMGQQIATSMEEQNSTDAFLEELSDDEAEMVAGGRMTAYRVSVNSYYHETGIVLMGGCCFWLKDSDMVDNNAPLTREHMLWAAQHMTSFQVVKSQECGYTIRLDDNDLFLRGGWFASYMMSGIAGVKLGIPVVSPLLG
jgi:predicted ribosomally synthesized peptide with nif11-like leader